MFNLSYDFKPQWLTPFLKSTVSHDNRSHCLRMEHPFVTAHAFCLLHGWRYSGFLLGKAPSNTKVFFRDLWLCGKSITLNIIPWIELKEERIPWRRASTESCLQLTPSFLYVVFQLIIQQYITETTALLNNKQILALSLKIRRKKIKSFPKWSFG